MKHPLLSKPNAILALLLAAWWLLNLVQGAFTELADDEAYYWFFSWQPAWGYFDHPPMTAILVWLGSWIPGTLGVRLFTTLLQPLCLYLFWTLIRPPQPSTRQAVIYFLYPCCKSMVSSHCPTPRCSFSPCFSCGHSTDSPTSRPSPTPLFSLCQWHCWSTANTTACSS